MPDKVLAKENSRFSPSGKEWRRSWTIAHRFEIFPAFALFTLELLQMLLEQQANQISQNPIRQILPKSLTNHTEMKKCTRVSSWTALSSARASLFCGSALAMTCMTCMRVYEYKSEIWNFFMVCVSSVEKMEMSLTEKKTVKSLSISLTRNALTCCKGPNLLPKHFDHLHQICFHLCTHLLCLARPTLKLLRWH